MNSDTQEKKLFKNTGILAVGTILTKCISFIIIVFYSAWLTSEEYGQFEMFISYVSLLIPFFSLSCGEAIFRFMIEKQSFKDRKELVSSGLVVYFIGFIISSVAACSILYRYLGNLVFYFIGLYLTEMIYNFCTFVARGTKKLTCFTVSGVINTFVMASMTVVFVKLLGWGLKGLIIGYCIGYIFASGCVMLMVKVHRYVSVFAISKNKLYEMLCYSLPLIPNSIAWWVASASDRTIVTLNLGAEYTGIYSIAHKIPSLCVIIYNVFHLSWQENASEVFIDKRDQNVYFNRIFNKILPTILSVSVFILSINYYMFKYVFDAKYALGYKHVWILVTGTIFSFLAQFIGGIFIGQKRPKSNGYTTIIAALTNIIVDWLLIHHIGLYAASVSTVVAYVTLFVIRIYLVKNTFRIRIEKRNIVFTVVYIYFIIMQFDNNQWLRAVNVFIAIVVVVCANIDFINMALSAIKTRLKKFSEK